MIDSLQEFGIGDWVWTFNGKRYKSVGTQVYVFHYGRNPWILIDSPNNFFRLAGSKDRAYRSAKNWHTANPETSF